MIHIGFSTTNRSISRLIRWFTKSRVSHTFVVFEMLGKHWVLEAGFSGISILPVQRFAQKNIVVASVPVPELTQEELGPALDALGTPYDFGGLLGSIFPLLGRWFKKKWRNPWNDSKAMFCSEFIVKALQDADFPGAKDLVASETTPEDVLDFLTEYYVRKG